LPPLPPLPVPPPRPTAAPLPPPPPPPPYEKLPGRRRERKTLPKAEIGGSESTYSIATLHGRFKIDHIGGSYVLSRGGSRFFASAASDLSSIGSTIGAANAAAAHSTAAVLPAASDEVSAAVASLFAGHGQAYQQLSAEAAAFHSQFVQALNAAGGAYLGSEAASTSPLQAILDFINQPTEDLLGRPLIGNGTNGAPGTGQNGQPGGLL
jgi:PE family